jgi:hypothetical protein
LATALFDSDYNLLARRGAPLRSLAVHFSSHVSFVHLHYAGKRFGAGMFHSGPDAVTEIPCRLIADSKGALELVGTHFLARLAEQVDAQEPLPQGEVGIIEDRASSHRELIAAFIAVKLVSLHYLRNLLGITTGTGNLIGPTKRLKISSAAIFASELFDKTANVNGFCHV